MLQTSFPAQHHGVPAIRAELVRGFSQLEALWEDWERLHRLAPAAQVFQRSGWARVWWGRGVGTSHDITPGGSSMRASRAGLAT